MNVIKVKMGRFGKVVACVDIVMLYDVREHLHQWYSISEIVVPSSLKLTIVSVIGPTGYCKLNNKFWNASKNKAYIRTTFKKCKLWSPLIFHLV